jgi:hemerythrin-like domain-containing protein
MSPTAKPPSSLDGFEVLDGCHRQTIEALETLSTLLLHLESGTLDPIARTLARRVVHHFGTVSRQHHEDEERHVFPVLARSADAAVVEAVLRLQQDHDWLEEDWMELSPQIDAIACGQPWYDLDVLREAVAVFTALSHDHIALEESVIYPEARARLLPVERRAMGREMSARRRAERAQRVGAGRSGAG